jgi:hypothetical protein
MAFLQVRDGADPVDYSFGRRFGQAKTALAQANTRMVPGIQDVGAIRRG